VVVDAAGYRERRRTALGALAERSARRAVESGIAVGLEPMSAVERKIVHEHLKEDPSVETRSEGTEPQRYVIISPSA
jgi:spoIIIJ-associated protein